MHRILYSGNGKRASLGGYRECKRSMTLAHPNFFSDMHERCARYRLCCAVAYCNVSIHIFARDGMPCPTLGLPGTQCHCMRICPWRLCQQRR